MVPRKKCLVCGSRQWRKNTVGLVACSEGHVLQHYINESEEADDVGAHTMRKRTLKSRRQKKERASRADPKFYHGDRARYHYYQCLQLLFRKQVAALTTLWNLPPEFETMCRDLWVFYLNLIPSPPPAEPFHYTREQEGYQCEPEVKQREHSRSRFESEADTQRPEGTALVPEGDASSSEDETLAPDIAVLLEENSEINSSDDGSSSSELHARNNTYISSKNPFASRADRPENTVAVLVLACWTIRLPVIYKDFINAIESRSLPYLDHVRALPSTLTRHLTKHAVQALSPHYAPKALPLHRLVSRLANRFYESFDVVIPEPNTAPVLWRVVQECFCGTPMLYILTKRIGNLLSLGLSLQGSISTHSRWSARRTETDSHKRDNVPPEISLVASAIVVLKLVYGLDGKQRLPRSPDDPACAFPAVTELLAAIKEADQADSRVNSQRFSSRVSLPVSDLDDMALDEYLDFCRRVLVDPKMDEHRVLDNYFPLATRTTDLMQGDQLGLRGRGLASTKRNDGDVAILEPGAMYTIYDAKDVLGNLSGDLKIIVERSARWTGIDCDFVCGVVERYERRLVRWWNDRRQERKGGDDQEAIKGVREGGDWGYRDSHMASELCFW